MAGFLALSPEYVLEKVWGSYDGSDPAIHASLHNDPRLRVYTRALEVLSLAVDNPGKIRWRDVEPLNYWPRPLNKDREDQLVEMHHRARLAIDRRAALLSKHARKMDGKDKTRTRLEIILWNAQDTFTQVLPTLQSNLIKTFLRSCASELDYVVLTFPTKEPILCDLYVDPGHHDKLFQQFQVRRRVDLSEVPAVRRGGVGALTGNARVNAEAMNAIGNELRLSPPVQYRPLSPVSPKATAKAKSSSKGKDPPSATAAAAPKPTPKREHESDPEEPAPPRPKRKRNRTKATTSTATAVCTTTTSTSTTSKTTVHAPPSPPTTPSPTPPPRRPKRIRNRQWRKGHWMDRDVAVTPTVLAHVDQAVDAAIEAVVMRRGYSSGYGSGAGGSGGGSGGITVTPVCAAGSGLVGGRGGIWNNPGTHASAGGGVTVDDNPMGMLPWTLLEASESDAEAELGPEAAQPATPEVAAGSTPTASEVSVPLTRAAARMIRASGGGGAGEGVGGADEVVGGAGEVVGGASVGSSGLPARAGVGSAGLGVAPVPVVGGRKRVDAVVGGQECTCQ